jgi:hypothetical protein
MTPAGVEIGKAAGAHLWGKTEERAPEFAEGYLRHCRELLLGKTIVQGCEFREYCSRKGLVRPAILHHNVWVSGPRVLQKLGWIEPMGSVEPVHTHNHMRTVTLWRSLICLPEATGRRRTRFRHAHIL